MRGNDKGSCPLAWCSSWGASRSRNAPRIRRRPLTARSPDRRQRVARGGTRRRRHFAARFNDFKCLQCHFPSPRAPPLPSQPAPSANARSHTPRDPSSSPKRTYHEQLRSAIFFASILFRGDHVNQPPSGGATPSPDGHDSTVASNNRRCQAKRSNRD